MTKSESKVVSNEDELKDIFATKRRNDFYDDQDLKTPLHDKIMDYIINDAMLSKIANMLNLGFKDKRRVTRAFICDVNDKWNKKEEFPIKIGYNFRYIDLCASIEKKFYYSDATHCDFLKRHHYYGFLFCDNELNVKKLTHDKENSDNDKWIMNNEYKECPYDNNPKECTLYESDKYEESKNLKMNIEVKTTIPSIGELIRQINTYRELNNGYYIVITPNITESLKNRLNNSDIRLIDTKQLGIEL